ncbi:ATP-dependent DNA helicase RecG [Streptoalloteichus tenebrarius]|uniref:ATP-dependent DNA helicase RecG n=1 Tax=Streptoalloteichus tenebrarius (strain ATCC 17920 / DSM 40477 / JCM 4838 / CBS 697.72 / NBRC 16177 / NCIMB 11028 / NRRL B-12390 / A12253. 1 / ISP 5477) TaxID=1933 RepID=A0ABT1HYZ9_STRSD|nr:OB-fold nucleic acid binding domain-containing protein [Streptoalloteichus tenebrarius]MCP2260749.1 ATP-dependent DNA helicase RecG [Streptoalloteichus tenebrarius]
MTGNGGGYWRRLVRRLTSDVNELDADDLSRRVEAVGARRAADCRSGEEATVLGRLRSVEHCPRDAVATLEAELFDGTEGVTLVWLGRRRIPGIEPGRTIKARGRIAVRDGRKVLYNPYYELQTTTA